MVSVLTIAFCVILLRFHPAFMNLTVIPKNTVVLDDDSTALGCNSSEGNFTLSHTPLEGNPNHFYRNKKIDPAYEKFGFRTVTSPEFGERNLAIKNVKTALAGKFECVELEDGHEEERKAAELIVIKKLPECNVSMDEFIGPNDCNIPLDEILLSCRVTYSGNKPPGLVWRKSGESAILNSTCTTTNNSERICNVTVQPDLDMNGWSFVCETTERASQEQYKCTTRPIIILYSFNGDASQRITLTKGDKAVCTSNSSMSCTYKWVWYEEVDDDLSRTIESTSNVLIANKIGLHRCEAHCKLRNRTCTIFPRYIEVIESKENLTNTARLTHQLPEKENNPWTPPLIVLLIVGVLQYFTFGCYLLLTRMRRKRTLARDRITACEYHSQAEV